MERIRAKSDLYARAVRGLTVPVQVLWGVADPVLKLDVHGQRVLAITGAPLTRLPGKHFLQEDCFEAIGDAVGRLAATADET